MTEDRPLPAARALSGRTAWARSLQTPLRVFLRTETGSAAVLVAMTVAALVWINISAPSYEAVWGARLSVRLAGTGVSLDLRERVNSGLMTFFFFVFGLEARREFDMGELRQRRRLALPVMAGLGGLIVPVGIYLAFNHGPAARGWGTAMSADTVFALGMLTPRNGEWRPVIALAGRHCPLGASAGLSRAAVAGLLSGSPGPGSWSAR